LKSRLPGTLRVQATVRSVGSQLGPLMNLSNVSADNMVYNVPSSAEDMTIRITNVSNQPVKLQGILYHLDGTELWRGDLITQEIPSGGTWRVDNKALATLTKITTWTGRASLQITLPDGTAPSAIRVLSFIRQQGVPSAPLSNMSAVVANDNVLYNIPADGAADSVTIRITNVSDTETERVTGTLIDQDGKLIFQDKVLLVETLKPHQMVNLTAANLVREGGATWSGRAVLYLKSGLPGTLRVQAFLRSAGIPPGPPMNLSNVSADNVVYNIPPLPPASADVMSIRVTNVSNQPVKLQGILYHMNGKQLWSGDLITQEIPSGGTWRVDNAALAKLTGKTWTGRATLQITLPDGTAPSAIRVMSLIRQQSIPSAPLSNMSAVVGGVATVPQAKPSSSSPVRFVKWGGQGDGTSWEKAFPDLPTALKNRDATVTEIWVARGTYNFTSTLDLPSLTIYGGFVGNEQSLEQRNWQAHPTLLTGAVVRSINSNVTLDGFTITGGVAKVDYGGGVFIQGGNPIFRNLIIQGNTANYGGGMAIFDSTSRINNVTFIDNRATYGGGLYNRNSSATLTKVTFSSNHAQNGGGFYIDSGTVNITNSIFDANEATQDGGGMYNEDTGTVSNRNREVEISTLVNVVFSNNKSVRFDMLNDSHTKMSTDIGYSTFYNNISGSKLYHVFDSLTKPIDLTNLSVNNTIRTNTLALSSAIDKVVLVKSSGYPEVISGGGTVVSCNDTKKDITGMVRGSGGCTPGAVEFKGKTVGGSKQARQAELPTILEWQSDLGLITLEVPPGAVTQPTMLFYLPTTEVGAGRFFDLLAVREGEVISDFTFAEPVTLTMPYSGEAEQYLPLYRHDTNRALWSTDGLTMTMQDFETQNVSFNLTQVGSYRLGGAPASSLAEVQTTVSSDLGTTYLPGGTLLTYQVTLLNQESEELSGAVVTDTLPNGVTFVNWLNQDNATLNGNIITWQPITVPVYGAVTISFTARASNDAAYQGQTLVNEARYSLGNANSLAQTSFSLNGPITTTVISLTTPINTARDIYPMLFVENPDGSPLTLQIGQPAHGIVTMDSQNNLVYTPTTGFEGTDSFAYTVTDGPFVQSSKIEIRVANLAFPYLFQNITSLSNTVSAGEVVTYSLTLGNGGDSQIVKQARFTVTLPSALQFSQWLNQANATQSGQLITWGPTDLLTNTQTVISFTAKMGAVMTDTVLLSAAQLTASNADPFSDTRSIDVLGTDKPILQSIYLPLLLKK